MFRYEYKPAATDPPKNLTDTKGNVSTATEKQ